MTELDRSWARTQVEAMADDSLSAVARRRMLELMRADPALAAEVERARRLRQQLGALTGVRVPRGLGRRLWQIPSRDRTRERYWAPAAVLAMVAVAALGISLLLRDAGPTPEEIARDEAVQDFAIAVAYLQRSALLARNEVNDAVGDGVRDAVTVSRQAMERASVPAEHGETDNAD